MTNKKGEVNLTSPFYETILFVKSQNLFEI